jgi:hypothetical protein
MWARSLYRRGHMPLPINHWFCAPRHGRAQTGIRKVRLYQGGEELSPCRQTHIDLTPSPTILTAPSFPVCLLHLFIKTQTGQHIILDQVPSNATIWAVKQRIFEALPSENTKQRVVDLSYPSPKVLADRLNLADYNIHNASILRLMR